MIWRMNQIQENKFYEVYNKVDGEFIFNRLAYNLNMDKETLLQYIDVENAKALLATLLINRNLDNNVDIINRPQDYLIDPHKLHNADKAAKVIHKYCKNPNAVIYIHGDYDVDGVSATYTMSTGLRKVSLAKIVEHYPNRDAGYGLSMEYCINLVNSVVSFEDMKPNKDILVITVDNGITKHKEVEYLQQHGIEVIITDHHTSKAGETPNCLIVDPHNAEEEQDDTFKHLCGCGVAFKVTQLVQELDGVNHMYDFLPHLAIATIADVMPMHTENLAIIQYGLDIMNSDDCPRGIKALKEMESIDLITAKDLGWTIAPMMNACGRIADTKLASKLYDERELKIAKNVELIKATNEKRKNYTKNAVKELAKFPVTDDKVFIWNTNEYPNGILGIIAGKASELFNKPSIVVATNENGLCHGSARSIPGFNLIQVLKQLKEEELIVDYGGHAEAAGIFFMEDKLDELQARFNELIVVEEVEVDVLQEEVLEIDQILTLENINLVMLALSSILPTDNKNLKDPVFAVTDVEVVGMQRSKANPDNVKLTLKQGKKKLDIWAWGLGNKYVDELQCPKTIHIAGSINKCFMTKKYVLKILDLVEA